MKPLRLLRPDAQLLIIDVQERLCAAMPEDELARMLGRTAALIAGAQALKLPVHLTEQYPKGLGPTLPLLRASLDGITPVEKLRFSAFVPEIERALTGRRQVLIAGMETHVCVFQTARDLAERGYQPVLCVDAVLSRTELDRRVGLELCRDAGAQLTTVEAALFDLLGEAGTPEFKAISKAVK
jgi:nicotinamidase-related amidase